MDVPKDVAKTLGPVRQPPLTAGNGSVRPLWRTASRVTKALVRVGTPSIAAAAIMLAACSERSPTSETPATATLTVSLAASPDSGEAPLSATLTATVSGTAQGPFTYLIGCGNGQNRGGTVTERSYATQCEYSSPGNYRTSALISANGMTSSDSVVVKATEPPRPTVTLAADSLSVSHEGTVTLSWTSSHADSVTAFNAAAKPVLPDADSLFQKWSGRQASNGQYIVGPLYGPDTLTFGVVGYGNGSPDTARVTVAVRAPGAVLPAFGTALTLCEGDPGPAWNGVIGQCYADGAVLPDGKKYRAPAQGRTDRGLDAFYFTTAAKQCSKTSCSSEAKINDSFIGSPPLVNDSISIVGGWWLTGDYDPESVAFGATLFAHDSVTSNMWCIAFKAGPVDCQPAQLGSMAGNTIAANVASRDKNGRPVTEGDTIIRDPAHCGIFAPCYFSYYTVSATKGLRAVYMTFAWDECNRDVRDAAGVLGDGCPSQVALFDRFGNHYTPGTVKTWQFIEVAPPASDRAVLEILAWDGVNPPVVKRIHVYVKDGIFQ
jgi:hypothetical protein